MSYRRFFEKLTGFSPHPYQERFAEELLRGRSVILRVPTGAGKTWAAVAPFLYALADSHRLSDRLLYALPLRSLASSLFASVHEKMGGFFLANVAPDLGSARFPFEKGTEMRWARG